MSEIQFVPQGELSFRTASGMHPQGVQAIRSAGPRLQISLASVTHVDSAGLAVLLDWLREAEQRGCQLEFAHLPPALLRLAAISEVDGLLSQSFGVS